MHLRLPLGTEAGVLNASWHGFSVVPVSFALEVVSAVPWHAYLTIAGHSPKGSVPFIGLCIA